jgi:prevent-host-death family protein
MVMKRVRIAELKARLSEHLRDVRRGESYAVMDRETPVARLVPYGTEGEGLRVRRPRRRYPTLQKAPLPPPARLKGDAVALLLEDREADR